MLWNTHPKDRLVGVVSFVQFVSRNCVIPVHYTLHEFGMYC